ncbi:MAG: hypothetical protein Q4B36_04475 [Tissierellia bacterium]|nr:hypothetical protein [Tissierellia bacterium]
MLLISNKLNNDLKRFLDDKNIEYTLTNDNPNLMEGISDHPDLSVFKRSDGKIVVDKNLYGYYSENLKGFDIIKGDSVSKKYPLDAIYNIVEGRDFYIHNNYTEKSIEKYLNDNKKKHLFVKQGYTSCSILKFPHDIFFTSDYGIYKSLKDKIKIYLLPKEEIFLKGFDNGFIGGTSGIIDDNCVIFTGDIRKLNSYDIIKKVSYDNNIKLLYPNTQLVDLGCIMNIGG